MVSIIPPSRDCSWKICSISIVHLGKIKGTHLLPFADRFVLQVSDLEEGIFGIAEHSDYGTLTLLATVRSRRKNGAISQRGCNGTRTFNTTNTISEITITLKYFLSLKD